MVTAKFYVKILLSTTEAEPQLTLHYLRSTTLTILLLFLMSMTMPAKVPDNYNKKSCVKFVQMHAIAQL